jgi:hypothetical protein
VDLLLERGDSEEAQIACNRPLWGPIAFLLFLWDNYRRKGVEI